MRRATRRLVASLWVKIYSVIVSGTPAKPSRNFSLERVASAVRGYGPALLGGLVAPEARFVILTPGRSGSELLVELLASQPGVHCDSEIIRRDVMVPLLLASAHAARAGLGGQRAYGFKVLVNQLNEGSHVRDPESFVRVLSAKGWLIITLTRSNLLRQAISWLRTLEENRYHEREMSADPAKIVVDPAHVIAMMVFQEELERFIAQAVGDLRHVALNYEDDLADEESWQASIERVMSALGLNATTPHSELTRTSPRALSDSVANYRELTNVIRQTRFAGFLDK